MIERQRKQRMRRQADNILAIVFLICVGFFIVANILTEDKTVSEEENRTLAGRPVLSVSRVLSGTYMERYEDYVSDQFVGRSMWRNLYISLREIGGSREENGVILGEGSQLMETIAVPDEDMLNRNIKGINEFALNHADIQTYMLLVPDSAAILSDLLPPYVTVENQFELLDSVQDNMADSINWIDAVSALQSHAEEKIYYKTDHHWTSLGAYYVFLNAAGQMGLKGDFTDAYDIYPVTSDFNGVLSSTSGFCQDEREEIEVYIPKRNSVFVAVNYVEDQKKRTSLYDTSKLDTKDKYAVFLGGNYSLVDIKTSSLHEKKLLLVKDSFANSFIPFLVPFYQEIIVVDPRYYAGTMEEIVEIYAVTDALFLYSGNTFFQDNNISGVLEAQELYQITDNEDFTYDYVIKDKNSNILISDKGISREPEINVINENLLSVSVQSGTGISTRWTIYCDVLNGNVSEAYYSVLGEYGENVAYVNYDNGTYRIVIQNIFNRELFYKETVLEDVSPVVEPVVRFEIEDNGTAKAVYLKGEDYLETEITIDLN